MPQSVDNVALARDFIERLVRTYDKNKDGRLQEDEAKKALRSSGFKINKDGFVDSNYIQNHSRLKVIVNLNPGSITGVDSNFIENLKNLQDALNKKVYEDATPTTTPTSPGTPPSTSARSTTSGPLQNSPLPTDIASFIKIGDKDGKYLTDINPDNIANEPPLGKVSGTVNCGLFQGSTGAFKYDDLNDFTIFIGKDKNIHILIWSRDSSPSQKRAIREITVPLNNFRAGQGRDEQLYLGEKEVLLPGLKGYENYTFPRFGDNKKTWETKRKEVIFLSSTGKESELELKNLFLSSFQLLDGRKEFFETFCNLYLKTRDFNFEGLLGLGAQIRYADSIDGLGTSKFNPLTKFELQEATSDSIVEDYAANYVKKPASELPKYISKTFLFGENNKYKCKMFEWNHSTKGSMYTFMYWDKKGSDYRIVEFAVKKSELIDKFKEIVGIDITNKDINEICSLFVKHINFTPKVEDPDEQYLANLYKAKKGTPEPMIYLGQFSEVYTPVTHVEKADKTKEPRLKAIIGKDLGELLDSLKKLTWHQGSKLFANGEYELPKDIANSKTEPILGRYLDTIRRKEFEESQKSTEDTTQSRAYEAEAPHIALPTFVYKDKKNVEWKVKVYMGEKYAHIFMWKEGTKPEYKEYKIDRTTLVQNINSAFGYDGIELDLDPKLNQNKQTKYSDNTKKQFMDHFKLLFIARAGSSGEEMLKGFEGEKRKSTKSLEDLLTKDFESIK